MKPEPAQAEAQSQDRHRLSGVQLPLDLPVHAGLSRDDLAVTAANRVAAGMIDAWPDWPGSLLVLAGPAGSGKTHLAGIWAANAGAETRKMADLAAAAPPASGRIVLEDATPGAIDETALFHCLNHVRAAGGSCLITSAFPIEAWNISLPDLSSRLRAAQYAVIEPPDDDLLAAVLTKLFADRQVETPRTVIRFLLPRMERSLEAARLLVGEIDREAMAMGGRITRDLAARVLSRRSGRDD